MPPSNPTEPDDRKWDAPRARLLDQIDREFAETASRTGISEMPPEIRQALAAVPRHRFVPDAEQAYAYRNHPLPIGCSQTISQPYIVAIMTALLQVRPDDIVLEIGTGSGYQAAVLSHLAARVYSVERFGDLADSARERLQRLGYNNVEVRCADGALGWPEHAPYDRIIVTAGAPRIPDALRDQLKPGGRLVIPVDSGWMGQDLQVVTKNADGSLETRSALPVAFVPLVSG